MKRMQSILAGVCAAAMLCGSVMPVHAETDTAYRQLMDYSIFNGNGNLNWCGGQNLEVESARIPIDSAVTCDGAASLRVNVTDTSTWWSARLVVRSWMSIDFSEYLPEGCLSFDVKGNAGNETFRLALSDHTGEDEAAVAIGSYTKVTNDWQHVSIPLSDFSAANPDMDFSDIKLLSLLNDGTTDAQKFWITNIMISSEGLERESPPIKVNQLGFLPSSDKYAIVSLYPELNGAADGDVFTVCSADTGSTVYEGNLELLSAFDQRDSGEMVLMADFSDLTAPGEYYVAVGSLGKSVRFSISDDAFDHALTAAQRYFYYQRQGIALEEEYAGVFARDDLGLDDSAVPFASGKSGTTASEKGWFDAGDSGKYVNTGAGTVSHLLWAYEMFPELFPDNALTIPESGNGIPDLLDEARWELEWILTMQDAQSGGFYPRIQGDAGERMIMDRNGCTTDDTACAVGALAEAYLTYKDWDPAFAESCLAAAEKGWAFLEAHPDNIAGYDVYVVSDDVPDRLWAAGALYRASGNTSCKAFFEAKCNVLAPDFEDSYTMGNRWGDNWLTGCWHYLLSDDTDAGTVQWLTDEIHTWREIILTTKWENNIWGVPLHKGNYFRGITAEICNMSMGLSMTDRILGLQDARTQKCAETSLSWLLGANPLGISYVTGCGENSIQNIYSQIYESDGIDAVPDGYLPQGPNYSAMKTYRHFAAKAYMDSSNDWVTNEHTVYGNGILVYLIAQNAAAAGSVRGDVNADGRFSLEDVVLLQKWILNSSGAVLADAEAGDLCVDGCLNGFDLCLMKRELLN